MAIGQAVRACSVAGSGFVVPSARTGHITAKPSSKTAAASRSAFTGFSNSRLRRPSRVRTVVVGARVAAGPSAMLVFGLRWFRVAQKLPAAQPRKPSRIPSRMALSDRKLEAFIAHTR
jgi:hypothetical protein